MQATNEGLRTSKNAQLTADAATGIVAHLPHLTSDVWQLIAHFIPLRPRLLVLCLVNKQWLRLVRLSVDHIHSLHYLPVDKAYQCIAPFPNLTTVDRLRDQVTPPTTLRSLRLWTRLSFNFYGAPQGRTQSHHFTQLASLSNLTSLTCSLLDEEMRSFYELNSHSLTYLRLLSDSITPGINRFQSLPILLHLRSLSLGSLQFANPEHASFASKWLTHVVTNLTALHISGSFSFSNLNQLPGWFFKNFLCGPPLTRLQHLSLDSFSVPIHSVDAILANAPALLTLSSIFRKTVNATCFTPSPSHASCVTSLAVCSSSDDEREVRKALRGFTRLVSLRIPVDMQKGLAPEFLSSLSQLTHLDFRLSGPLRMATFPRLAVLTLSLPSKMPLVYVEELIATPCLPLLRVMHIAGDLQAPSRNRFAKMLQLASKRTALERLTLPWRPVDEHLSLRKRYPWLQVTFRDMILLWHNPDGLAADEC